MMLTNLHQRPFEEIKSIFQILDQSRVTFFAIILLTVLCINVTIIFLCCEKI